MTYGIKALRQIQMSREVSTSQGSPSTDFTVWRGLGTLEDTRETTFVEEDIGVFGGVDRTYVAKTGAQINIESTPATFEQLPHILDAAVKLATPTTDASSAQIRTYAFPISTSDAVSSTDLQTYSFKVGDNNEVEQAGFGYVSEFTLSGSAGEALMMEAVYQTREATTDNDGFATVSIPDVEEILFSKGKLYIDEPGGTMGATQKSNTLLSAELKVTTGWMGINTGDGRTDFSFIKQVQPEIILTVTFEHDGTAAAEKSAWRTGTARQVRLTFEGDALGTTDAGAPYDKKTLVISLAGKWEKFDPMEDQDGDNVVTGTFRARYNATCAKFAEIVVVNELAVMPG